METNFEYHDDMMADSLYSVAQSIRDDLSALKAAPLVRKELVESARGYLFDIKTGLLSPVQ